LTGTSGTITLPPQSWPRPLDDAAPALLAAFNAEFFVDWQVADIAPLPSATSSREN
jgi:hypothetical protein